MNRIAVIACAVLEAEIKAFARDVVRIEWLPQGLHDEPPKLRAELQIALDRVEAETDADTVVLGYGLCCRGTEGVKTKRCRLVIACAHDCITHLLGSKERYAAIVKDNPGTYWYSPGWIKHAPMPGQERYDKLYREYVEKYGEDNAQFLMDNEQHWFKTYNQAAFVDLGAGDVAKELAYTRQCAKWLGWGCEHHHGDPALLKALLTGPWDAARFVVLNPGQTFRVTGDERVIEAVDA